MVELKEIEEKVLKIVELNPNARYVVLVSRDVSEEIGRALSKYINGLIIVVKSVDDIRLLEIDRHSKSPQAH